MDTTTSGHDACSQSASTCAFEVTPDTGHIPRPLAASAHANASSRVDPLAEWLSSLIPEPDDHPSRGRHSRNHDPNDDQRSNITSNRA